MGKKKILDSDQVNQIIKRLAFQVYENNLNEKSLVVVGIGKQGARLSQLLGDQLKAIAGEIKISFATITLDKEKPAGTVDLKLNGTKISNQPVVLVDDVLNTGRTLVHSLMAVLEHDPKHIEVTVLVDRGHKLFPVNASYAGYQLATTLEEHIEVRLGASPSVYLY